jgi:MYXO-CTERM domain-containing protein
VLNSETNLPEIGIFPGTIQPGVTYSTPIGEGNFFNIDAGGGYTGGFLDGFNPSDREVTVAFHGNDPDNPRTIIAFGFDTGGLSADTFDVLIQFSDGPDQLLNFAYPDSISFFGFVSDAHDITSVVIGNNGSFFGFDFDNFTYETVPGPGALALLGIAGVLARRRRRTS